MNIIVLNSLYSPFLFSIKKETVLPQSQFASTSHLPRFLMYISSVKSVSIRLSLYKFTYHGLNIISVEVIIVPAVSDIVYLLLLCYVVNKN